MYGVPMTRIHVIKTALQKEPLDKRWTTHVFEVNISVQEDGIRIAKSVLS